MLNGRRWPLSERRYECAQPLSLRDPNLPVASDCFDDVRCATMPSVYRALIS